jgi:hypothetical protein
VKDRPWEVKETLLLSRKCPSASERHLCPQAIHKEKSYKTHSPTWPMGPLVSGCPCIPHYAVFLFSTNSDLCCWSLSALSFSEQAQEAWAPEIPVGVIHVSYLVTKKGPAITWGQYRLCQTGEGCLGMWLWASSTPMECLATVELSSWLSC